MKVKIAYTEMKEMIVDVPDHFEKLADSEYWEPELAGELAEHIAENYNINTYCLGVFSEYDDEQFDLVGIYRESDDTPMIES